MANPKFVTTDSVSSYTWAHQPALGSDNPTESARYALDRVVISRGSTPINHYLQAKRRRWHFLFTYKSLADMQEFEVFADAQVFWFYPDAGAATFYTVRWATVGFDPIHQMRGLYNLDMVLEVL